MMLAATVIVVADVTYQLIHFNQPSAELPTWISATPPIASFLALAALILQYLAARLRKRDQDRLAAVYGLSGTLVALSDLPSWMRWVWPKPQHQTAGTMAKVRATSSLGRFVSFGLAGAIVVCSAGVTVAMPHHFFVAVGGGGTPSAAVQPTATLTPTATSSTANCAAPPLDASATQVVGQVAYTTGFEDWQSGTLAPENNLTTFTLKQSFVTAVQMNTNEAGTLTAKDTFCNDGHSSASDTTSKVIPANTGNSWVFLSLWIYTSAQPTDVGKYLETLTWNGVVVANNYVTIGQSEAAYSCPAAPPGTAPDFSISNLMVTAPQVSESQVSYLHFQYTAKDSGKLEFFVCIDGTTIPSGQARTVGAGSNSWQQYENMIQDQAGCSGCQWYGDARWYVVWNHQVVGQVPFTVTQ